ncbi:acid protease [Pluteus cervinus]|uniref:Acid protease n=1 Tax=Pluteus cervinus TaxID=181527 RepID=A0ACD3ARD4_9AGAR|nr:acid protease [Pluteus cervinus]
MLGLVAALGTISTLLSSTFGLVITRDDPTTSFHQAIARQYTKRTPNGIHLPIVRTEFHTRELQGRAAGALIGLGNFLDVSYNVLLTVGDTALPVVLDTGSADLWVLSDRCTVGCAPSIPLYPQDTFKSTGLEVQLFYGDSKTGTHAFGLIGQDTVNLAGLTLSGQFFGAINNTNTSIEATGSSGIFGLGFPINSGIWSQVFGEAMRGGSASPQAKREVDPPTDPLDRRWKPNFPDLSSVGLLDSPDGTNMRRSSFPDLSWMDGMVDSDYTGLAARQTPPPATSAVTSVVISTYASLGPLLSRLAATKGISLPGFTVTLQRNTIDIGGNVGMLSIGELPPGVRNESLTWVPLRGYTQPEGGLPPPKESPSEVYPLAWEVFVDDVYFDGELLPRSSQTSPSVGLSALIDTGNSLIRGPSDVINEISKRLGGAVFSCKTPHTLAFSIGGKIFPVDPRDFIRQARDGSTDLCTATLTTTDPPVQQGKGYRFTWSLGDPFIRGVLASFYYGNLSYPSVDPPRMGFLSTVPSDANAQFGQALQAANANGGEFPQTSNPPLPGTPIAAFTNPNGVPEASAISRPSSSSRLTPTIPSLALLSMLSLVHHLLSCS